MSGFFQQERRGARRGNGQIKKGERGVSGPLETEHGFIQTGTTGLGLTPIFFGPPGTITPMETM